MSPRAPEGAKNIHYKLLKSKIQLYWILEVCFVLDLYFAQIDKDFLYKNTEWKDNIMFPYQC